MDRVVIIRANDDVTKLLMQEGTDWDLDHIQVYNEKKLECKLNDEICCKISVSLMLTLNG